MEAPLVGADGKSLSGVPFTKMSGSGNDFVFFDGRDASLRSLEREDVITRLCARGPGVGADGVVWVLPGENGTVYRMRYRNSDGSIADMCGNASLCSITFAARLGLVRQGVPFEFDSDAGRLRGLIRPDGKPQVTLTAIKGLTGKAAPATEKRELRIGFADSGVPHLVVEVGDAESVDLPARGRALRFSPELAPAGANVNFVSKAKDGRGWRMRTYERGVEGETLACGTGAAATGAVLRSWGSAGDEVVIETTSGRDLLVSIHEDGGVTTPSLSGEGRIVFDGVVTDL